MILVDYLGHLVSTESEEELHKFAQERLDMSREYYEKNGYMEFKHPFYDLMGQQLILRARVQGAEKVTPQELVERAW